MANAEDYIVSGLTSKLPVYGSANNENSKEHKIIAAVYERPSLKAPYDVQLIRDVLIQSKRYQNLRPQIVLQILGKRRNYLYLKKFAIYRLEANLRKQFGIFFEMIQYNDNGAQPNEKLSHGIFSWNWNDFLTRRELKNYVWVDVLLRTDNNGLHIFKFRTDLEELKQFLDKILNGFLSNIGDENVDIYKNIEKPIEEAKNVLHTTDFVEDELFENTKVLKQLEHKEYFLTSVKRDSEEKCLKSNLENRLWNSHIWDPIEMRYHITWYNNIVKQGESCMNNTIEKYKRDIDHYSKMFQLESFINDNCMDYCYSSIEVYKNRLNEIQDKFDKEFNLIENRLVYKRIQIDKLLEQRKWLSEEIERFRKEEALIELRNNYKEEKSHLEYFRDDKKLSAKLLNKKKDKKAKDLLSRK